MSAESVDEMFESDHEKARNLLLNIGSGLDPSHLSKEEEDLLESEYGEDWREKLL